MSGNHMTARAFLAKEIRRAREAKEPKMSRAALGKALLVSKELVAAWEAGRSLPRPEYVKQLINLLEFDNEIVVRLLEELVTGEVSPEWTGKWREIEKKAAELRSYDLSVVPGLLQTPEYARATLQNSHHLPLDPEELIRERLKRQKDFFERDDSPTAIFLIDEQALRRPIGGPKIMHDQLMHLVEMSERPNVIIRVVPIDAGFHLGLDGSFMIAKFDGIEVAYQGGTLKGHVLEDVDEVYKLSWIHQTIDAVALTKAASAELIVKMAEQWKT